MNTATIMKKKYKVTYRLVSSFLIGLLLVSNVFLMISTFIINQRQPRIAFIDMDNVMLSVSKKVVEELRKSYKDEMKQMLRYYTEYDLLRNKTKGKKKSAQQVQKMKQLKRKLKDLESIKKQEIAPKAKRLMRMFLQKRQKLSKDFFERYDFIVVKNEGRSNLINSSERMAISDKVIKNLGLKVVDPAKEELDFLREYVLIMGEDLDL